MSMTDPIADMFTRIRNAQAMGKPTVSMPASKVRQALADLLKTEGYVLDSRRAEARGTDALPKVLGGLGISIVSTSSGLMTDAQARAKGLGGEVIGRVA